MAEWLISLETKIHKGDTFRGGELKDQNIKDYFESLSYDDLYQWWTQYQC
jgi:hypothetical protein